MKLRKIALCVESWWSEENHYAWNFVRKRLLQEVPTTTHIDRLYIVHVTPKGKETENWDKGTAVLGDVRTELASFDHTIVELNGDVVTSIVNFIAEQGIDIAILSLKDQNRVKKTLSMGTAHQILARANCACTIVRPMFSAGDHLRIQAKLQPDVIVANSAMQFRRRVAVVMNSSFWDSALAQYAALKVILPGDRVILVRCLNENINKKNVQDLQVERDYLRELGWHKFKKSDVSLAVEVVKSQTRMLCEFLEEKGVDLVIMSRFDSNKLKRSIKKENASFQSFPHRCPCPIMIASTEVLRPFNRFLSEEVSDGEPFSPFSQGIFNRKTWSNALSGSHFRPFRSRRCQSMDIGHNQNLRDIEFGKREDSIEMSSSAMPDYAIQQSRDSWQSGDLLLNRSPTAPETSSSDTVQEDEQKEAVVRQLQQKLSEKEQEILHLKQCLSNLQNN